MNKMNKEVLEVINFYSRETKFAENIIELINMLLNKLNDEVKLMPSKEINNTLHEFYNPNEFEYYSDFKKIKNEVIEPILNKIVKEDVKLNRSTIHCSNGHDAEGEEDVEKFEITYNLNSHKIIFHIHTAFDKNIIYASIFIDDWFHFIVLDSGDELGYFQQSGDYGIQTYNETKGELFYKEFNIENIYNDIEEFYTHLLQALFLCIPKQLECQFEDDEVEQIDFVV